MIAPELRTLVQQAINHARASNDDSCHTMGAALLTQSGRTALGVNSDHFLGGSCAEIVALSNHAASCPSDPIRAVVAADGRTGAIVPPCGKCRQVFFDLDPESRFVVRKSNGFASVTVRDLLPFAYESPPAAAIQRIYMWEGYESIIRDGTKRQTIRIDDPFSEGAATIVFEREGGAVTLGAYVTEVQSAHRSELTEAHAVKDGFANLAELNRALDRHYPDLADNDIVDIVTFSLENDTNN